MKKVEENDRSISTNPSFNKNKTIQKKFEDVVPERAFNMAACNTHLVEMARGTKNPHVSASHVRNDIFKAPKLDFVYRIFFK